MLNEQVYCYENQYYLLLDGVQNEQYNMIKSLNHVTLLETMYYLGAYDDLMDKLKLTAVMNEFLITQQQAEWT